MNLKTFNPASLPQKLIGNPTITISANGNIYLSKSLMFDLELKPGDKVSFVQDQDNKIDWFIKKDIDGFQIKFSNGSNGTGTCLFRSPYLARVFMNQFEADSTIKFRVARKPIEIDEIEHFAILASSLTTKK